jgi:hypothetical protein
LFSTVSNIVSTGVVTDTYDDVPEKSRTLVA